MTSRINQRNNVFLPDRYRFEPPLDALWLAEGRYAGLASGTRNDFFTFVIKEKPNKNIYQWI